MAGRGSCLVIFLSFVLADQGKDQHNPQHVSCDHTAASFRFCSRTGFQGNFARGAVLREAKSLVRERRGHNRLHNQFASLFAKSTCSRRGSLFLTLCSCRQRNKESSPRRWLSQLRRQSTMRRSPLCTFFRSTHTKLQTESPLRVAQSTDSHNVTPIVRHKPAGPYDGHVCSYRN